MCTLAIYFKVSPLYPLIIAANRDEFLDRPATGPVALCDAPRIIGGRDIRAGGTWLGINEHGLVCGLLNRHTESPNPNARSRGILTLDVLKFPDARAAARFASQQDASDYNPFNLLIASADAAFVAHNRVDARKIEVVELVPGLHLLSNRDVNDFECPKISASYSKFAALGESRDFLDDPIGERARLAALLADHNTQLEAMSGIPNALCLHLENYGTRSSSLIFVGGAPRRVHHFFAPGPPCKSVHSPAPCPELVGEIGDRTGDSEA